MSRASRQVIKQIVIGFALAGVVLAIALFAAPARASTEMGCDKYCGLRLVEPARDQARKATRQRHRARNDAAHWRKGRAVVDANGNDGIVRSKKTGATAHVAPRNRQAFQVLIDRLEYDYGAAVYYMGGWRAGSCSLASQHPCGGALDICQDSRGHVSGARDCKLPPPAAFHALVRELGLYDGSVWCNGDYGHVQVKDSGGCGLAAHGWARGHYFAAITGTIEMAGVSQHKAKRRHASRHHRHRRLARL
jgi:hypothetical protein